MRNAECEMRSVGNRPRLSTFNLQLATLAAAFVVAIAGVAQAQIAPYYNIVSVNTEQLNNAVRLKINTDGAISVNVSKWLGGSDYYLIWDLVNKQTTSEWSPDCYPRVNRIFCHLDNARPQLGSVVRVGMYPVSHIRFSMTPEKDGQFGVDVEIVLYKPMRFRGLPGIGYDAYLYDHHDPEWFEVIRSSDSRSLIITVASDRLPDTCDHRKLGDVPEADRELKVGIRDGLLDVHARNVGLAELLNAVSQAGGRQMIAGAATERVVTAELPGVTQEEFAERIAECYGLVLSDDPNLLVFSDIADSHAEAAASFSTRQIPTRWATPWQVLNRLPNFLLGYVRVDEERNELVVSGTKALLDKVEADVAKIDQPASMVSVSVIALESLLAADLTHELGLGYTNDDLSISANGTTGELTFSKIGALRPEFRTELQALLARQSGRIKAESSVAVASGETGEVFAGQERYIQFRRLIRDPTEVAEPISIGVRLMVTPWIGNNNLTLKVVAEVQEIGEIDLVTHLPVVNARSAEGTFALKSGETIMIGGLSQTQDELITRKIPILGDLPLIGRLFRREVRHRVASELTVLLTPTVNNQGPINARNQPGIAGEKT